MLSLGYPLASVYITYLHSTILIPRVFAFNNVIRPTLYKIVYAEIIVDGVFVHRPFYGLWFVVIL